MDYEIVIPVLISFAISAILGPIVIPFLKRLKVGQTERKELESHLKKNGTPTMGGLMILASIIITSLFYVKDYPRIIPILFMTVGFGVIGFLDDYLKVVLRRSDGLLPWQKMILQFIVTTVFAVYMVRYSGIELTMLIPFSGGKYLNIGWLAIPLLYFAVIGTVNGVNFTDGLDGLASSVTILVATFFSGKCFHGRYRFPGTGRLCCGNCLYAPDAIIYPDRWTDLSGRSHICYGSGYLF